MMQRLTLAYARSQSLLTTYMALAAFKDKISSVAPNRLSSRDKRNFSIPLGLNWQPSAAVEAPMSKYVPWSLKKLPWPWSLKLAVHQWFQQSCSHKPGLWLDLEGVVSKPSQKAGPRPRRSPL